MKHRDTQRSKIRIVNSKVIFEFKNIGKKVQEIFWRKSSPFTKSSTSSSSSPPNASIVSLILLKILIEGEINLKTNSINSVMNNFIKNLLPSELKVFFTLTINRNVHEFQKYVDEHVKGLCEENSNKHGVVKCLNY